MCSGEMKKLVEAIQEMPKIEQTQTENSEDVTSGDAGGFFIGFD